MEKRLISFDPETNAKLRELSKLYDLPVAWLVRKAVSEWLTVYLTKPPVPQLVGSEPPKEG